MKYSISYFYQIRFFKRNQIPISTALWDPKWFHNFESNDHVFIDKHGIINGLRSPLLNPTTAECGECEKKTIDCPFKKHYLEHLRSIDFQQFTAEVEAGILDIAKRHNIQDPEVVLIVYETPDNPCSERAGLQTWFKENGKELTEFRPTKSSANPLLNNLI